ncbi:hypothetical protein [Rhodobacter capsulatus]|jgi:hypothetical protein|uniref:Lipoprotein, putative n=1 Tax=Rhodobacter capsulatus (strain ATCC BAA-309 / NBRC 16581 / SB1003) TaxID=272942 RepID=D5ATF2_RHOCB|nr:hypothetical protein [Rhodobacter capsulatus]ADE85241.1 lipoprotein, putative [Rhodobacter capsulatus SB 1003]ETD01967.1 hypothetical protein U714_08705 [Rhodobacter capsulatus DE442]ETD77007.1 hypothetical protein U717_08875 [Rhodobacter capsulatus R121]ETE53966.1 hypothetical protein U715_08880 [Rhodobacter capsulatus Y262]MDS0926951.1 hypothetical protein [Rhodobacter capsulatus]
MLLRARPAPVALSLALALALSGCGIGKTKLNPWNWFTHEEVMTLAPKEGYPDVKEDPRELIAQVTALEVKQTQGGAIVAATGLTPTQGWWGAKLLAENDGKPVEGVMTYRFVVAWPDPGSPAANRISTPQSREVTAAAFINNVLLAEVTKVVVIGAETQRSISR